MSNDALAASAAKELGVSLVKPLAQGGQKSVWIAKSGATDVALKVVKLGGPLDEDTLRRAEREVDLLRTANSKHLVKAVSDLAQVGKPAIGIAWLEELLPGKDLLSLLGPKWNQSDLLFLLSEVSQGLCDLHKLGVVHRDLSPGNVRQLSTSEYKILDPGLARHMDRSTLTGTFQPGTLGYMTPEHVNKSAKPTPASDVFALGVLAYQAATGTLPIPTPSQDAYFKQLLSPNIQPVGSLRTDLPTAVTEIISRCLNPQPARRYLNGCELHDAVKQLLKPATSP